MRKDGYKANLCERKKPLKYKEAVKYRDELLTKDIDTKIYKCFFCRHYHLGKVNKNTDNNNNEIMKMIRR